MKQNGGLHNQLAPKKKNNPKLNRALLIINCILFLCALVGILYIHYQESRTSIPMFLIAVVTAVNSWTAWRALKGHPL